MARFVVGVDLGQLQDYTAIAVVGSGREHPPPGGYPDGTPLEVRHLERIPLGTRYPEVVERVRGLMDTPPIAGSAVLVVDATGVGVAVTDMLREAGLRFKSVTITSGDKESSEGASYRVPKRELITGAQVLLQQRRLKIARSLDEAETLIRELTNFRYKITSSANITYESWREAEHDDLVLALSLAVWEAKKRLLGGKTPSADMAYGADKVFGVDDEKLFSPRDGPRW